MANEPEEKNIWHRNETKLTVDEFCTILDALIDHLPSGKTLERLERKIDGFAAALAKRQGDMTKEQEQEDARQKQEALDRLDRAATQEVK